MQRLLGIAASAFVVLGLTGWTADHAASAPVPPTEATISINGIHGGAIAPSAVESFELGVSSAGTIGSATSGAASGRTQFSTLHFTIAFDQTAPLFATAVSSGRPYPDATLTIGTTGSIKLMDVRVTSVRWVGGPNGVSTQVDLAYGKIEWNVGKTRAGYDVKANKVN